MPKAAAALKPSSQQNGTESATGKKSTKAKKAGLLFPVTKINKRMSKSGWTDRVGGTAPVWISATAEFIAKEILMSAADTVIADGKHKRITPRDVILAIRNDAELNRVFAGHKTLVGDKLKGVASEVLLEQDKRYKAAVNEMATEVAA